MMTEAISLGFGLYAVAAGAMLVMAPARGRAVLTDLRDSAGLSFLTGLLVFFIGAVLLVAHHKIDTGFETFITVVSALTLLEGLVLLAFGTSFMRLMNPLIGGGLIRIWGAVALAIGAVLIYLGAVTH